MFALAVVSRDDAVTLGEGTELEAGVAPRPTRSTSRQAPNEMEVDVADSAVVAIPVLVGHGDAAPAELAVLQAQVLTQAH